MTYLTLTKDKPTSLHLAVKSLFENLSTSRKLFRLFKFMNDYIRIREMLKRKSDDIIVKIDKGIQIII